MKENKVRLSGIVSNGIPEAEPEKELQDKGRSFGAVRLSELKYLMNSLMTKSPAEKKESEKNRTDSFHMKDLLENAEKTERTFHESSQDISRSEAANKAQKLNDPHKEQEKGKDKNDFGRQALMLREQKRVEEEKGEQEQNASFQEDRIIPVGDSPKINGEILSQMDYKKAAPVNFPGQDDEESTYNKLKATLHQIKERVKQGRAFTVESASDLIFSIVRNPNLLRNLYLLTITVPQHGDYNISHQVNTMVYALKIGMGFSFNERRLHELGMSALLHDVGMFLIPESITEKDEKLKSDDLNTIKQHPIIGRDILDAFDHYPWLAEVAYHHHERENGQGYPDGLHGNQISEYAKIVGIVDSYEAMTHNRPYRKALMQSFSAKELIKSKNMLFSTSVIKVFLKEISLYPLGSFVRLNNKAIGQVIGTDQTRPLRPDIRILFDGEGNRVNEGSILRLDQNPIFFIQDSVSEEELPVIRRPESKFRVSG